MTEFAHIMFLLIAAHALADYPLQGDFLAQAKNRHTDIGKHIWPHGLIAHSFIHGGFVFVVTGSAVLGVFEIVAHAVTDWLKCENKISYTVDQAIHIGCKVLWSALIVGGLM